MKISFPLSLKVSLWLLLNLLLLSAIGVGWLAARGGFGWDSLVRGPAGKRAQELGSVVVGEAMAATDGESARAAVLERFGASYHANFYFIHPRLPGAMRPGAGVPAAVTARVEVGPGLRDDVGNPGSGFGRPERPDGSGPPGGGSGPLNGPPSEAEQARGRFLVHTRAPDAYWLGVRVPIDRPVPVTLVARVDSWWGLMQLLDLQPWLVAGGAIMLFSVLFWLPFVHSITQAIGQLTLATGQIADGRFDTRVPAARRDELGALGSSVNQMAARLDTLVNGQKRFLADIAHELGSPIGRLQVAIEILESRADPALRDPIADVRDEVQQMSALVSELLAFTKAGLRPREAELAAVELAPLLSRVLQREDTAARVTLSVPAGLAAHADAPLLSRALGNLVRNALRYAGDAGPIQVTVRREDSRVLISVEDEGPGVAPAALERLGEPFYRPEAARQRETGGVGLGLAIVRSAMMACGGEVRFANRAPRGFLAELALSAA